MTLSNTQLSFADYLSFFGTRSGDRLTYDQLLQLLSIHGFVQIRAHKYEIIEALGSISLMDPTQSMANGAGSGSTLLGGVHVMLPSLEQMLRDIDDIGWEECPIGSIQTIQPAQLAAEAFMVSQSNSAPHTQVDTRKKAKVRLEERKQNKKTIGF